LTDDFIRQRIERDRLRVEIVEADLPAIEIGPIERLDSAGSLPSCRRSNTGCAAKVVVTPFVTV